MAVRGGIVKNLLHLRGHRRSLIRRGGGHGVHIGQHHLEGIGGCFDDRLYGAVFIKLIDPADAGAVALDQTQAMEHLGKILVAGL